jgi:uncharacterized protein (DUF608 family)
MAWLTSKEATSITIVGRRWRERLSTGSYLLYHQPETGAKSESILSDQLIGQYFAVLHGLVDIFPAERVRTVLETIWSHNVKIAQYGVRTSIRPDLSTDAEGFYSVMQCPSYSSLVPASLMICYGDAKRGLALMHSVWHQIVIDPPAMAWDMPAHMRVDGGRAVGLEYYHNTMLWTLPIVVLGQDLGTFCAPEGLGGRIVKAARRLRHCL